ncbi:MAG: hypothetical protein FJ395_08385 [Verrucomicrobia bacterium]|nr:hypothetical protein [Verrucomicrobiota bacterium]
MLLDNVIASSFEVLSEQGVLTPDQARVLQGASAVIQALNGARKPEEVLSALDAVRGAYRGLVELGVVDDKQLNAGIRTQIKSGVETLNLIIKAKQEPKSLPISSSRAENWYAGTWDASGLPVINGHPTTVALRVEVLSADSGLSVKGAEVQIEGEWVDEDGLKHDFRLSAFTDSKGIAIIGLGWRDERRQSAVRLIEVPDDIEKAQRMSVRRSGYAYDQKALNLPVLKRDKNAWKKVVRETPQAKYFMLMTGEDFKNDSTTSTIPLFFQKVRDEDYYKVFTADAFPGRELDIPNFRERLTIGPFIALPFRVELRSTVTDLKVNQ